MISVNRKRSVVLLGMVTDREVSFLFNFQQVRYCEENCHCQNSKSYSSAAHGFIQKFDNYYDDVILCAKNVI